LAVEGGRVSKIPRYFYFETPVRFVPLITGPCIRKVTIIKSKPYHGLARESERTSYGMFSKTSGAEYLEDECSLCRL